MPRFGTKYLLIYNILFAAELSLFVVIGVTCCLAGSNRFQFGEVGNRIVFTAIAIPHFTIIFGNCAFILIEAHQLQIKSGRLLLTQQLMLIGCLIPWFGISIRRRLWNSVAQHHSTRE